ncbi:phytanoyl-CoA dioxygenase family protein [Sanyastnella coralliicola]|uniref:phytanoyl-CoA dioxygenase family protein n=1 Tax=Sanyastnella coralliicola TaxID=3069118 RepID=UPI0027B9F746|nr:phytanoyl-CoA dioxygenase family protein [Longitalea sp. SCSIO 12813]
MAKLLDKYWGFFRRVKPAYHIFNMSKRALLQRNKELYKQYGLKKSVYAPISSADFKSLPDERPWSDDSTDIRQQAGFDQLDPKVKDAIAETWVDGGYAILRGYFSEEFIDNTNAEIDRLMEDGTIDFNYSGKKIMFAYRQGELMGKIARDKGIVDAFKFLLGKNMVPFQSINFFKSSEQRAHSDSIHMTTYPLGYLTAAWVALEDIGPDQGPLQYWPGSHKFPYVLNDTFDHGGNSLLLGKDAYLHYEEYIQKMVAERGIKPETLYPKKGDVFLWHGNLIHGAIKMNDPSLTRKSMVVHYMSPEVICYHEITQRPALIEFDNA